MKSLMVNGNGCHVILNLGMVREISTFPDPQNTERLVAVVRWDDGSRSDYTGEIAVQLGAFACQQSPMEVRDL